MSPEEMQAAVDHYNKYDQRVLRGTPFPMPDGGRRQNINFSGTIGDDRLDGLLGTATGYFDKDRKLTGIRDIFDFDDAPRSLGFGDGPLARAADAAAGKAVGLVQRDANTFCPGGSNPVRITGGGRR